MHFGRFFRAADLFLIRVIDTVRRRYARHVAFIGACFSPEGLFGLILTIGATVAIGAVWTFGGIAEDLITGALAPPSAAVGPHCCDKVRSCKLDYRLVDGPHCFMTYSAFSESELLLFFEICKEGIGKNEIRLRQSGGK